MSDRLDLDVHSARKVQAHERVDGFVRRLFDIDEPVVDAKLKVLHRLLVDVGTADHAELADSRRERDGATDSCACPLGRVGDLLGALVEDAVVVGPDSDSDRG